MMASSTVKSMCKKIPSGAEKKRAKLRRNFAASLAMLSPEDPTVAEEKANSKFIQTQIYLFTYLLKISTML